VSGTLQGDEDDDDDEKGSLQDLDPFEFEYWLSLWSTSGLSDRCVVVSLALGDVFRSGVIVSIDRGLELSEKRRSSSVL